MADAEFESPEHRPRLLHLLKAGRVLQYRQQNVALVSAAEGTEFDITYAERWVAPHLEVDVGDETIVVLADSPYRQIDPARFATVTAVERDRGGLQLTIALGPWPIVEADTALVLPERPHPTQPPYFAWRATADAVRPPRSEHERRDAWRHVVGRLRGNKFYADSNFARLVRVLDSHGREARDAGLVLGETSTALVEVHSPGGDDHVHSVLVDSDPSGSVVGGIEKERADSDDHLHVPVRPVVAGQHRVELSFVPEPLLSTRLTFTLEAHVTPADGGATDDTRATAARPMLPEPTPGGGAGPLATAPPTPVPAAEESEPPASASTGAGVQVTNDPALVQGLAQRVRRIEGLDGSQWLDLVLAHVLPLAPDDPLLRSMAAEAAYDVGDYATVVDLLDDPGRFRTGDAFRRLSAGLRYAIPTEVAGLLREIDLGAETNVARLAAELPSLPDGAVRAIATVILDQFAGEDVLDRLLPDVFDRLGDTLALRVVKECAPADPDGWLRRALARWPDPHRMPDDTLDEVLTWDLTSAELAPYVHEAVNRRLEDDHELQDVLDLVDRARSLVPAADFARLRAATGRALLTGAGDDGDVDGSSEGRNLLLAAALDDVSGSDPDLATELALAVRSRFGPGDDADADAAVDRLRAVLDDLAEFRDWRARRDEQRIEELRPSTEGRTLHVVGGREPSWAVPLAADLGLAALRWHESGDSPPPLDWVVDVDPARDLVIVIWTECGPTTRRTLSTAGVDHRSATLGRSALLDALHPRRATETGT